MDADGKMPLDMLLYLYLKRVAWTSDDVALILRKQKLSGLPVQKLEGCLFQALRGSEDENHEGLKKILILLIEAGINVYSCDPFEDFEISFQYSDLRWYYKYCWECRPFNSTLRARNTHRDIWNEALTACGYDADQVILNTRWSEWFLGENDYELQASENSSCTSSDELESSTAGTPYCLETHSNASDVAYDPEDDHISAWDNTSFEQQDWSMLEGDAAVWRTLLESEIFGA